MRKANWYAPGSNGLMDANVGDLLFIRSTLHNLYARRFQRSHISKVIRVLKTVLYTDQGETFTRKYGWKKDFKFFANVATAEQIEKIRMKERGKKLLKIYEKVLGDKAKAMDDKALWVICKEISDKMDELSDSALNRVAEVMISS